MKNLLIVTHVDFWRLGAGHRTRISSLITYFKTKISTTVVYAGVENQEDKAILEANFADISFVALEKSIPLTYKEYSIKFQNYIAGKFFDFVLVEYIEMSFVLPFLDRNCITILDTHDLVSERIESFQRNNLSYDGIQITEEEELEVFNCFDFIIAIQQNDYVKVKEQIGGDRTLLVPHPVSHSKKMQRKKVKHLGFVASGYSPNVSAITWFTENVWMILCEEGLTLNIYGNVCYALPPQLVATSKALKLHGFLNNLEDAYEHCDIMINPVQCGAGLKIKNIEALGNGLPLITTSHGAIGMESEAGSAYLIADTAQEFITALETLANDFDLRQKLGTNAYNYAREFFSQEKCYASLFNLMTSGNT